LRRFRPRRSTGGDAQWSGSTFKVVVAAAFLSESGNTPATRVPAPEQLDIAVLGRSRTNRRGAARAPAPAT
jgi:hypothetical protein